MYWENVKYLENVMNIPMNNHSQTRPNYCISSFPDAKKKDKDEYSVLPFSLPLSIKENKKYLEKMH